jgi:hypothetical protein
MIKRMILILTLFAFLLSLAQLTAAEMQSSTYRMSTSVFSAGGTPMSSTSYKTTSTLGQPSPLMDPLEPPLSDTYDLYPGFWYAVMGPKCESDYDGDGDVDGSDLAEYLFDPGGLGLDVFAADFGRANCP